MTNSNCRACDNSELIPIHAFAPTPYGDTFLESQSEASQLKCEPLELSRCSNCFLLQLRHDTDLDSQYRNYLYFTRVTHKLGEFYENVASTLYSKLHLSKHDLVLDIGSNDGTFLSCFKSTSSQLLGVDPSKPACEEANKIGIEVINEYFNSALASRILDAYKAPKLITCNYTIANVPNLTDFFTGLATLASSNTQINIITGYHLDQFQIGMFDYIGHDHLTHLTVHDFQNLCDIHGLKINYARRHEHKGGSLEIGIIKSNSSLPVEDSVSQLLQREMWLGANGNSSIHTMINKIELNRSFVYQFLSSLKVSNVPIFGTGASISTTSLLFNFQIGTFVDKLYDDDPRKVGRFSPGFGIEVDYLDNIAIDHSSVNIILAWQHTTRLLSRLRDINYPGLILLPMPEAKLFRLDL